MATTPGRGVARVADRRRWSRRSGWLRRAPARAAIASRPENARARGPSGRRESAAGVLGSGGPLQVAPVAHSAGESGCGEIPRVFSGVGRTTLDEARLCPVEHAGALAAHVGSSVVPQSPRSTRTFSVSSANAAATSRRRARAAGSASIHGSASTFQCPRRFLPTLSPALATACTASSNRPDAYVSRSRVISSGAIEGGGFGGSGFF